MAYTPMALNVKKKFNVLDFSSNLCYNNINHTEQDRLADQAASNNRDAGRPAGIRNVKCRTRA